MAPFESLSTVSYSLSVVTNYGSVFIVLEIKRYIGRNRDFSYPLAFDAPVRGLSVGILSYRLIRKNENDLATDGEKHSDDLFSRFDRIPACDGRTDGHIATSRGSK